MGIFCRIFNQSFINFFDGNSSSVTAPLVDYVFNIKPITLFNDLDDFEVGDFGIGDFDLGDPDFRECDVRPLILSYLKSTENFVKANCSKLQEKLIVENWASLLCQKLWPYIKKLTSGIRYVVLYFL